MKVDIMKMYLKCSYYVNGS